MIVFIQSQLLNMCKPTYIYGVTSILRTDQKGKRHLCYWVYWGPHTSLPWHESHFIIIARLLDGQSVYLIAFSEPNMVPGMHRAHNNFCGMKVEGRRHERKEFSQAHQLKISLYIFSF